MLLDTARGMQDRGNDGASMPDSERGSGLGDRSHGGEVCEVMKHQQRRAARIALPSFIIQPKWGDLRFLFPDSKS
jgi:hypothetical protein